MKNHAMNWNNLLSAERIGRNSQYQQEIDSRNEFTRDWDRIVFSSAFRRMQDKTQVFPLAKNDYIRTRLTHSLEVASVGRSLGMLIGEYVLEKENEFGLIDDERKITSHDFGAIVAAACLAHDIGNPPFGHAGESAIQEWFEQNKCVLDGIDQSKKNDFLKFEGNAQGFRLLTRLQHFPQEGGMQLTYAVLGAFTKYPRSSAETNENTKGVSSKKFGFMSSESDSFATTAAALGLKKKTGENPSWHRHPLAFVVEAADDICYHIMDVEDGFKAGVIQFENLLELHKPWLNSSGEDKLKTFKDHQKKAEYLRAITIGHLIKEAVDVFKKHYDEIMCGEFDVEITDLIYSHQDLRKFKELAISKIYCTRPVLEIEACGFEVIGGLLNAFVRAVQTYCGGETEPPMGKVRTRTLIQLLPEVPAKGISKYQQLQIVTDFVSGMTDTFAVELYQRIKGISLA